jgi:hypothetical protein
MITRFFILIFKLRGWKIVGSTIGLEYMPFPLATLPHLWIYVETLLEIH